MTPDEILDPDERAEQLTSAPKAVPEDAAPRITLSEGSDGATRIDIADTAAVRPGGPDGDIRVEFVQDVEAVIEIDAGPEAD